MLFTSSSLINTYYFLCGQAKKIWMNLWLKYICKVYGLRGSSTPTFPDPVCKLDETLTSTALVRAVSARSTAFLACSSWALVISSLDCNKLNFSIAVDFVLNAFWMRWFAISIALSCWASVVVWIWPEDTWLLCLQIFKIITHFSVVGSLIHWKKYPEFYEMVPHLSLWASMVRYFSIYNLQSVILFRTYLECFWFQCIKV